MLFKDASSKDVEGLASSIAKDGSDMDMGDSDAGDEDSDKGDEDSGGPAGKGGDEDSGVPKPIYRNCLE